MRFMHANKEKVFDQSKVESKKQDEKVKAKKSKDKIETLNKSMMSSDSSFNTDDDSEEEKEKVAPLNERPAISSPNVMKLKSLRLKDLKSIKKTLNIDEPKRISQKLDIFKHEFLYDKRKKEGSILNKMSIVSQNTLNFKPMISRQDVSDLSSSKPDIEEKSVHFKAGSILKFFINFIDENRRSLHVPRKIINYSNRTPDRKFWYSNKKINGSYHLIYKSKDKSQGIQILPSKGLKYPDDKVPYPKWRFDAYSGREWLKNNILSKTPAKKQENYNASSSFDSRSIVSFDMSLMTKRDQSDKKYSHIYSEIEYEPDKEVIMKNLRHGSVRFSKQTNRKNNYSTIYKRERDISPEILDYNNIIKGYNKLGHIKSNVPSPLMDKLTSREQKTIQRKKQKVLTIFKVLTGTT